MPPAELLDPNTPIGDGTLGTIGEFWQWAMSDLLSNTTRGIFAEYLISKLLGIDLQQPRIEWHYCDVEYQGFKIEVKTSAYVQSWHHEASKSSPLRFSVESTKGWDAHSNTVQSERKRWADVYVFCVFAARFTDPTINVLDLDQWQFYVTATAALEQYITLDSKGIGFATVKAICGDPVPHYDLKTRIDALLDTATQS